MIRTALIVVGLVVSLEIAGKEQVLAKGETLLLELAPRDPRSIMQGDYMTLRYTLARDLSGASGVAHAGATVVERDGDGIARFVRVDDGQPLSTGQHRLTYRFRGGEATIGTNAYFFEEGTADQYETARYGEVRVAADGTTLLVGLRDADRRPLGVARRTAP
jgi:uncharacterized membrane-anchored protein